MKLITIRCEPKFYLGLSLAEAQLIQELANAHYDSTCRQAGALGGFVYGWVNRLTPWGDESSLPDPDPIWVDATSRQLDLVLKILEFLPDMDKDKTTMVLQLCEHIHKAMHVAQQALDEQQFVVPVP